MPRDVRPYSALMGRPNDIEATQLALSVIVPVYNEEPNIERIYRRLTDVLTGGSAPFKDHYELIFVDDGSSDQSFQTCADIQQQDDRVVVIQFRRNFGKTAALQAGFHFALGERIVTIDADMQEDPSDIFKLLEKLDTGYDLVSAWRQRRNDPIDKTLPSLFFNAVVSRLTGVKLHDFNCGFKAYRRAVVEDFHFYGDQHRFIPVLASQRGFRVTELPVDHAPRKFGKSKYGSKRLLSGYLDFLQVLFLVTYLRRPMRLFGTIGTLFVLLGVLFGGYLTVLWFISPEPIGDRPLLILSILLIITGLQFISTGLIGEMLRNDSTKREYEYSIRTLLYAQGEDDHEHPNSAKSDESDESDTQ